MLFLVQTNIHYTFKQVKWLESALTHSSFTNEASIDLEHNERLEFLGDAVLELVVSELLFIFFPDEREGSLTAMRSRLVSQPSLARLAKKLRINEALRLGRGEEQQGGREREALLCDAFEAVLGAVFMDGGFAEAKRVARFFIEPLLSQAEKKTSTRDNKSKLQEYTQKKWQALPVYALIESKGPEHAKVFVARITLPDGQIFNGEGSSLKGAEQAAAAEALQQCQST